MKIEHVPIWRCEVIHHFTLTNTHTSPSYQLSKVTTITKLQFPKVSSELIVFSSNHLIYKGVWSNWVLDIGTWRSHTTNQKLCMNFQPVIMFSHSYLDINDLGIIYSWIQAYILHSHQTKEEYCVHFYWNIYSSYLYIIIQFASHFLHILIYLVTL